MNERVVGVVADQALGKLEDVHRPLFVLALGAPRV
jgi:hypothetical protein